MKVSAFLAVTADGLIADPNIVARWQSRQASGQTDYGFSQFYQSVDRLIVGRHTFTRHLGAQVWPYGDKKIVVLSRNYVDVPATLVRLVELSRQSAHAVLTDMWRDQARHVYVDGALTVRGLLGAGLITDLALTRLPLIAGQGQSLGSPIDDASPVQHQLSHQQTQTYPDGVVQSFYQVVQAKL